MAFTTLVCYVGFACEICNAREVRPIASASRPSAVFLMLSRAVTFDVLGFVFFSFVAWYVGCAWRGCGGECCLWTGVCRVCAVF